jgi:hypothetical protein
MLAPVENVSLPFWCDCAYDWEARCYRLDGPSAVSAGNGVETTG